MTTAFDHAQAVYDAAEPEESEECHHDGDFTYLTSDDGAINMICNDCCECLPDPESEEGEAG